ncbi:MAG: histidine kinase dimerization/phospho-acceptor domain-containing protein, partial [Chloroflexota bacterium]
MPATISLSAFERFGIDLPTNIWGWVFLLLLIGQVSGLFSITSFNFRSLKRSQIVFFMGSLFLAFVLSGFQLNITRTFFSSIPLIEANGTGAELFPFGFWIPLLIGYTLGPLPALLTGLAEGLGRSFWGTHQIYDIFIYGIAGWIVYTLINQRYRERIFELVRQPFFATLLTLSFFGVPALFLADFGTVELLPFVPALDSVLMSSRGHLLTTFIEAVISGTVATLLTFRFQPHSAGLPGGYKLSPFSRSYALQLLSQFLLYSFIILLLITITVSSIAYGSARNLLISQMRQDGGIVTERIVNFQRLALGNLVDGGRDQRLIGENSFQAARLEDLARSTTYFRRILLVQQRSDSRFDIVAAAPAGAEALSVTEAEGLLLNRVITTNTGQISSGERIENPADGSDAGGVLIAMAAPVARSNDLFLIGRVADTTLNDLTSGLSSISISDDRDPASIAYILDEAGQIIAHPNPSRLLSNEPITEAALIPQLSESEDGAEAFYHQLDDLSGQRKLEFRRRDRLHPWTVVLEVPMDTILGRALRTVGPIALIIVPATLLFAAYLAWRGAALSNRLNELLLAAENMVSGNYNTPIELEENELEDDLGQLGSAFNKMQKVMQQRLNESNLLLQVSQVAAGSLTNFEENSQQILKWLIRGTGAAGARMIITTRATAPDYGEGPASQNMKPFDRQVLPAILQNRELYLVNTDDIREFFKLRSETEMPFRSVIGYPLRGARDYGALWLTFRDARLFEEFERSLIRSMCQQAGVMVQNDFLFTNANRGRKYFETVINNTTDPVMVTDATRRVTYFNPSVTRELELNPEEIRLREIDKVFTRAHQPSTNGEKGRQPAFRELFSRRHRQPRVSELELKNGKIFSATISPIIQGNNRVTGHVVIFRDITSFRELDELKSDFVRMASHELRSPIAAAKIALNLLPYNGDLNDKQVEKTTIIENRLIEMETLVNDLLNLGRLEANFDLELRRSQINDLVREVIYRFEVHAAENGNSLAFEPAERLPLINVDSSFIILAISNLVGNAIKYTVNSGEIKIKTWINHQTNEIIINVKDNGPGIP